MFTALEYDKQGYHQALTLRHSVLRAPLGLTLSDSDTQDEQNQFHFGWVVDGQLKACVVFKPLHQGQVKLRQMAVDPECQGQGIGQRLIEEAELWLVSQDIEAIVLSARESAVSFYRRLGYAVSGHTYREQGISHLKMEKTLTK